MVQVVWTERAENEFAVNIDYVERKFGERIAEKFVKDVLLLVDTIKNRPLRYPFHDSKKGIRKCKVRENVILYYRPEEKNIYIMSVFHTKQDPENLGF